MYSATIGFKVFVTGIQTSFIFSFAYYSALVVPSVSSHIKAIYIAMYMIQIVSNSFTQIKLKFKN